MKVPEQYRVKNHPLLGSSPKMGCNSFFVIPHHRIADYFYNCMVYNGMGWEHVSVTDWGFAKAGLQGTKVQI